MISLTLLHVFVSLLDPDHVIDPEDSDGSLGRKLRKALYMSVQKQAEHSTRICECVLLSHLYDLRLAQRWLQNSRCNVVS